MIYLILSAGFKDNNPDQFERRLKIGYTDNLENRLKAYQTTNPDFMLLQTREGDTTIESYLHKKFEKYRYKDSKEWFYYNQEIIDYFQDKIEDFIDEGILLECIKKDLRSKISSVSELKEKYLNQILDEVKSLDEFDKELYDEEAIISSIVSIWEKEIIRFNKSIDDIRLLNYSPIDILKLADQNICLEVDISQDLPQILGRQRLECNPWKNQATFYYRVTCDYRKIIESGFEMMINAKKDATLNLLKAYDIIDVSEDQMRNTLAKKYHDSALLGKYKNDYVAVNTNGGPVFNNMVYISDLRAYEIQQIDYRDRFVFCNISTNITKISKAIGVVVFDPANLENHVRSTFNIGDKYSLADIKIKLQELYKNINYNKTAKATDLKEFFEVSECLLTRVVDGEKKRVKGYELLSKKEN